MKGYLLNKDSQLVAEVDVEINMFRKHATGVISVNNILPADMQVFQEYLNIIEEQIFILLDSFEEIIISMEYILFLPEIDSRYPVKGLYITQRAITIFT